MSDCHAATVTRCDSKADFGACSCSGYIAAGEPFDVCPCSGYSAAVRSLSMPVLATRFYMEQQIS